MKVHNRVIKILRMINIIVTILLISACSKYRSKFAGHNDDTHLNIAESKSLMVPAGFDVKPYDTTYDIPKVYSQAVIDQKELILPPGFK